MPLRWDIVMKGRILMNLLRRSRKSYLISILLVQVFMSHQESGYIEKTQMNLVASKTNQTSPKILHKILALLIMNALLKYEENTLKYVESDKDLD